MRRGYFTKVENYLFEEGKYLTPTAKLVYVVLCSFQNNKSGKIYPSYEKIMARSGLGKNKVAAALNELHAFGWITRRKVFIGGNHYELLYPWNKQPGLPREWPTKVEAKEYAQFVRERKPHYGTKPWDEEDEVHDYDGEQEYSDDDDDLIPF
jgi:Helix-turn-helix domain